MATKMTTNEAREILNVNPPYSRTDLRHAYLTVARKWHPDVAKQAGVSFDEANAQMACINQAYALLLKDSEETYGGGVVSAQEIALYDEGMTMTETEAEEYINEHEYEFQTMRDWTEGWYGTKEGKETIDQAHRNGYFPNEDVQQGWLEFHYGRSFPEKLKWRIATTNGILPQATRYKIADALIAVYDAFH